MMNTASKRYTPSSTKYEHSPQITERRRALFPNAGIEQAGSSDSDLGQISPLTSDSNSEEGVNMATQPISSASPETIGDYDIIGVVQTPVSGDSTPQSKIRALSEDTMSPLYLSPFNKISSFQDDLSPTQTLKTPHKTNATTAPPKLIRKTLSLFPEVVVPTRSFYPKLPNIKEKMEEKPRGAVVREMPKKPIKRRTANKRRYGQINAGVGHKIRKPKQRKLDTSTFLQTAASILDNSPLNDYLEELKTIQQTPSSLIENKENNYKVTEARKRPLSPEPPPDPKRKFFKFSRQKATVTVNESIKLEIDHGKQTLITQESKRRKITQDFDLIEVDPLESTADIDELINSLNDQNPNNITLQAHNSIAASENQILLHTTPSVMNILSSPTSQMCDMTSGLALNSPKKAKDLTKVLNGMPSANDGPPKLYPIFEPNARMRLEKKPEMKNKTPTARRFKAISENQMLLDAGQKRFGVTQCIECDFVYHIGDPSDELVHKKYHDSLHILKFSGWKNERVVGNFGDARIIQIIPGDCKSWWKKVKEVMEVVNRDLGCYDVNYNVGEFQVFLYVKSRIISGCLLAKPHSEAYRMLTSDSNQPDFCSEESYTVRCGVSHIWVAQKARKQGIATAMMNCLKKNFLFGEPLKNDDIALSSPATLGKEFAKKYFGTSNYLIYC